MNNVAVSKASGVAYRHRLSRSILKKRFRFVRKTIEKEAVKELLLKDLDLIFNRRYRNTEDFVLKSGFSWYLGDSGRLLEDMNSRRRTDFLLLTYLGKMRNALRTAYTNCDLSNLIFLSRLNRFAELLEEISGKPSKVMVAGENYSFDYEMFMFKKSNAIGSVKEAGSLAREFGMKNIEVRPLETFLGAGYEDAFEDSLDRIKGSKETRRSREFKNLYSVFLNATSSPSFEESVRTYTRASLPAGIRKAAEEAAFRYIAFQDARRDTDFWSRNSRFIRSTVSTRRDVLTFKYEIGRLAPFQGMSVHCNSIGTEFLYDIIYDAVGNEVELPMLYYHGKPFLLEAGRAIPGSA